MIDKVLEKDLICPKCRSLMKIEKNSIVCTECKKEFPMHEGIPLFFSEIISNEKIAKESQFWNKKENTQENLYENMTDSFYQKLISVFNIKEGSIGLELGCGDGPFARRLSTNLKIFGLDISIPLLKITKNLYPVQGNALELPFKDSFFNWIIYAFALHHMVDLDKAISEVIRVLAKQGKLIIVEPNYYHPLRYLTRKPNSFFRTHVFKYLSPEEKWIPLYKIKKIFKKNNIKVNKIMFVTPEFKIQTLTGLLQRFASTVFNFPPFNAFVNSYYVIIGTKE